MPDIRENGSKTAPFQPRIRAAAYRRNSKVCMMSGGCFPRRGAVTMISKRSMIVLSTATLLWASAAVGAPKQDVHIDELSLPSDKGETIVVKNINVRGTNETTEEVKALFQFPTSAPAGGDAAKGSSAGLSAFVRRAKALEADEITIEELRYTAAAPASEAVLRGLSATHVAGLRIGAIGLRALDWSVADKTAKMNLKTGALRVADVDLSFDFTRLVGSLTNPFSGGHREGVPTTMIRSINLDDIDYSGPNFFMWSPAFGVAGPENDVHLSVAHIERSDALRIKAFRATSNATGPLWTFLRENGYEGVEFDAFYGMRAGKDDSDTLTIALSVDAPKMAKVDLAAALEGIPAEALASADSRERSAATQNATIRSVSFDARDRGLATKLIAFIAKAQQKSSEDEISGWMQGVTTVIKAAFGDTPEAAGAIEAIRTFLASPSHLSLEASADPSKPATVRVISAVGNPTSLRALKLSAKVGEP